MTQCGPLSASRMRTDRVHPRASRTSAGLRGAGRHERGPIVPGERRRRARVPTRRAARLHRQPRARTPAPPRRQHRRRRAGLAGFAFRPAGPPARPERRPSQRSAPQRTVHGGCAMHWVLACASQVVRERVASGTRQKTLRRWRVSPRGGARRGWQGLGAGCRRAVGGRRRRSEAGALAVWRGALFPDGRGWPCCGSAACKQLVGLRGWSCSCVQAAGGAAWLVMQLRASSWWSLISCVIGAIAARNPQTVANAPQHTPTDSCSLPFGI